MRSRVLTLIVLLGCGGGEIPESKLPAWNGRATELFDDVIEPQAVGLDLEAGGVPRADPLLRERTQTGDAVVRVRIQTITQSGYGRNLRHQLTLQTLEKLAGDRPPPAGFAIELDESSPSAGILRSLQTRLGGVTFVAFVKAFAHDGEHRYHVHVTADSKVVRDAVAEAVALGDLQR